ncbi:putative Guanine nucleotide-binding protein subunit beta-like protein 1 [Hypsibius exemplaris]|uniref:Guanine nucleotide-binding protein subunit beta-like protein 1 n=1 Tax=Hypsibius exemplaris TaxID=2072580 RepID=A0A1W0WLI8_HYPEX|nr:putative Guanine nucleotide-binding protein subunit beta-like protein 1 [Hypsibius exemplaris]
MSQRVPQTSLIFHDSAAIISSLQPIEHGPLAGNLVSGSFRTSVSIWDVIGSKKLLTKFQCNEKAEKNSTVLWTHSSTRQPDELIVQTREGILHRWKLSQSAANFLCMTSTGSQLSFCPAVALEEPNLLCVPSGEVAAQTSGVGLISHHDFSPVGLLLPDESTAKLGSPTRMVQVAAHQLLVAYENADLFLWDVRSPSRPVLTSEVIKSSRDPEKEDDVTPLALDFDVERGIAVVGNASGVVKRFKLGPAEMTALDMLTLPDSGVAAVRVRPDGKILTVACWDFTARVFSWKNLKPLAVLDLHKETVQCVEYMEMGGDNCVVLGGKDAMISIWPLY